MKHLKVQFLLEMAKLEQEQAKYSSAFEYLQQALSLVQEEPDYLEKGRVFANLASIYHGRSDFQKAFEYYQKALEIFDTINNDQQKGVVLGNLAGVYQDLGDHQPAIEYYQQSLALHLKTGNKQNIGVIRANLGSMFREQEDFARAIEEYEQALLIHEEIGHQRFVGIVHGELGETFYFLEDFDRAQEEFAKSIEICDEIFPLASGSFRASWALLLSKMGHMSKAYELLSIGEEQVSSSPLVYAKFLCRKAQAIHAENREEAMDIISKVQSISASLNVQKTSELSKILAQTIELCQAKRSL